MVNERERELRKKEQKMREESEEFKQTM